MGVEHGDSQQSGSSGEDPAGPVGGERLAASRRQRGISVHEIAKELHLDEAKVRALEENRFDVLGAPVFAKGHMRKYADLVGVPIDDMLADYYQLNRAAGAPPVVGPPRKTGREISLGPWIAGGLVLLALAVAAWWWTNRDPTTELVADEPAIPAPFESERQEISAADDGGGEAPIDEIVAAEAVEDTDIAAVEPAPEPVVQEQPAGDDSTLDAGSVEVALSFSGDCWTEVTDATGRRLYFGLGTDGRSVTVRGVEPLGVLLGNGSNVSITVNGLDYVIPAADRRGNTARLTIYGQ
jgi:cytoskeleton protein RodZ